MVIFVKNVLNRSKWRQCAMHACAHKLSQKQDSNVYLSHSHAKAIES